ncbi:MAG: PAS domain S-box protein [Cellulosilyticaceae bacterium]
MDIFDNNVLVALNLSLEGVFIENLKGDILMCNQAGAEMFGYTREEIIKLNIKDFVPPQETYYLKEEYNKGDLFPNEYIRRVNIKKDGTLIHTEVNSKIIISKGVKYLIAFVRNISEPSHIDPRDPQLQQMDVFYRYIKEENKTILTIYNSMGKEKCVVPLPTIEYIESNLKKIRIYLIDGLIVEGYGALNQLEQQIPDKGSFLRCYQSYIINMKYAELDEEQQQFVMTSGAEIPIRKRQYLQIKQMYYNYRIFMK